jgi:hypothetical protein
MDFLKSKKTRTESVDAHPSLACAQSAAERHRTSQHDHVRTKRRRGPVRRQHPKVLPMVPGCRARCDGSLAAVSDAWAGRFSGCEGRAARVEKLLRGGCGVGKVYGLWLCEPDTLKFLKTQTHRWSICAAAIQTRVRTAWGHRLVKHSRTMPNVTRSAAPCTSMRVCGRAMEIRIIVEARRGGGGTSLN